MAVHRDSINVKVLTCLVSQRLDDFWVAMSLVDCRVCRKKVKVLLAVDVPHLSEKLSNETNKIVYLVTLSPPASF